MNILIFTGNSTRHKFVANTLVKHAKENDNVLVVSETRPFEREDYSKNKSKMTHSENHFYNRYLAEQKFFSGNDSIKTNTLPLVYGDANLPSVEKIITEFKPDIGFVFGSSIIRDNILSLIPKGAFINMHLGLSPYYRGHATNFWPFFNKELEYVGATLLHIDAGIDTGDIITHIRPELAFDDNGHSAGCKTILAGVEGMKKCMDIIRDNSKLNRVKQWKEDNERYYKRADFNEDVLKTYLDNIENGLVRDYVKNGPKNQLKIIDF